MMTNILVVGDSHTAKIGNCVPDVFLRENAALEFKDSDQNYVTRYIENGNEMWLRDSLRMCISCSVILFDSRYSIKVFIRYISV